jgi:hypothetical protein
MYVFQQVVFRLGQPEGYRVTLYKYVVQTAAHSK